MTVPTPNNQYFDTNENILVDSIAATNVIQNSSTNLVTYNYFGNVITAYFPGQGTNSNNTTAPYGNGAFLYNAGQVIGSLGYSFSVWLRQGGSSQYNYTYDNSFFNIITERSGGYGDAQLSYYGTTNTVRFDHGSSASFLIHDLMWEKGDWHHIAVVTNGGTGSMFIDGQRVTQQTGFNEGSGQLRIGADRNNSSVWRGDMRLFKVWSGSSLIDAQIEEDYNNGMGYRLPNTTYFNLGSDLLIDEKGSNNLIYNHITNRPTLLKYGKYTVASFQGRGVNNANTSAPYGDGEFLYRNDIMGATFTFAGWIHPSPGVSDSGGTSMTILHERASSYGFCQLNYDSLNKEFDFSYGSADARIDGSFNGDNKWTHIAGTHDGSTIKLYANGSLIGTDTGATGGSANQLRIPASRMNISTFAGMMHGLDIWTGTTLTGSEIEQHYYATQKDFLLSKSSINESFNSCIAYYPMKGNHDDLIGEWGISPTASNVTYVTGRYGEESSCGSFNGTSAYVNTDITTYGLGMGFSISGWFNTDLAINGTLFGAEDSLAATNYIIVSFSSGKIRYYVRGIDNTGYLAKESAASKADGNWHHIMITYDKTESTAIDKIKLYIDGVEETTNISSGTYAGNFANREKFYFGAKNNDGSVSDYYTGLLSDMIFWNRTLSAGEARNIYSNSITKSIYPGK